MFLSHGFQLQIYNEIIPLSRVFENFYFAGFQANEKIVLTNQGWIFNFWRWISQKSVKVVDSAQRWRVARNGATHARAEGKRRSVEQTASRSLNGRQAVAYTGTAKRRCRDSQTQVREFANAGTGIRHDVYRNSPRRIYASPMTYIRMRQDVYTPCSFPIKNK